MSKCIHCGETLTIHGDYEICHGCDKHTPNRIGTSKHINFVTSLKKGRFVKK